MMKKYLCFTLWILMLTGVICADAGSENTEFPPRFLNSRIQKIFNRGSIGSVRDENVHVFQDKNGLMGYKDGRNDLKNQPKILIDAQYDWASPFTQHGVALVYKVEKNPKKTDAKQEVSWQKSLFYINQKNEKIADCFYLDSETDDFKTYGLRRVVRGNKVGLIGLEGKMLLPAAFDYIAGVILGDMMLLSVGCKKPVKIDARGLMTEGLWAFMDRRRKYSSPTTRCAGYQFLNQHLIPEFGSFQAELELEVVRGKISLFGQDHALALYSHPPLRPGFLQLLCDRDRQDVEKYSWGEHFVESFQADFVKKKSTHT